MLAKLTSKNQLTLPKSVTDSLGPVQYFEVQVQSGQVVLTPVRIQRGDAVRAKLAELELGDELFAEALAWAADAPASTGRGRRSATARSTTVAVKAPVRSKTTKVAKTKAAAKTVKSAAQPTAKVAVKAAKPVPTVQAARTTRKPAAVKTSPASKVAKPAARRRTA